jgi:hypothetical protein
MAGKGKLPAIVHAESCPGAVFRLGQDGQQERRQYGNNGDDHEEFNQRERAMRRMPGHRLSILDFRIPALFILLTFSQPCVSPRLFFLENQFIVFGRDLDFIAPPSRASA